jgi:hypothetical protein
MVTANDPFIRASKPKVLGLNIANLLGHKETLGDIGIEIEMEGNTFKKQNVAKPWKYVKDGSLRGFDNAEYVLTNPIKFKEVPKAIKDLWKMLGNHGTVLDDSNRTSVHIHLNTQQFHLNRLCSFVALYVSVEEILTQWCGDHRVGNLFCLRAKDAHAILTQFKRFFNSDGSYAVSDGMHYAGLNAQALFKFGSIEIRALRGVTDPTTVLDWVAILERIYNLSAEFEDPREICQHFSGGGPLAYLEWVLGDMAGVVREGSDMTSQELMESLYEGIQMAQDVCYCRDWSLYVPKHIEKDPFGRSGPKVLNNMMKVQPLLTASPGTTGYSESFVLQNSVLFNTPLPEYPEDEHYPDDNEEEMYDDEDEDEEEFISVPEDPDTW